MEILYVVNNEFRTVFVDATIRETHRASALITEHPVAEGADITDHIRPENPGLTAEVHITNTPIRSPNVDGAVGSARAVDLEYTSPRLSEGAKGDSEAEPAEYEDSTFNNRANVLQFDGEFDRVQTVFDVLVELMNTGTRLTIVTSMREYDDMVIADIEAPRDAASRHALTITLEFRHIRTVATEVVNAPEPLESRAERNRRRGNQDAEDEESGEASSLAANLLEEGTGINLLHSNRPNGNSLFR